MSCSKQNEVEIFMTDNKPTCRALNDTTISAVGVEVMVVITGAYEVIS
jgi:hypothetical protein